MGFIDGIDDAGVSIIISSLMPDELPLMDKEGGGVRMRSSKRFQKSAPAEFRMACCVNELEARRC